ncbi:glycosyltransferase [Pseudobutyrivibrio ruminis]|uniref:glycosyltransferase n=1 Tax=Pseudobutyrivibrio ruminis TaxID=46206 RepID=UPI000427B243|nr:glycosyltransferase [Pseudobutyrivibrio ruminis]
MDKFETLSSDFDGKQVLYITTKNLDYIRVTQEIDFLKANALGVTVIGSKSKSYPKRLMHVWKQILGQSMEDIDVTFVGFAPQLVVPFFKNKLKQKQLVIDFFISVYDTMVLDRKKFKDGGIVSKLCHKLDEATLKQADAIVCDTKAHGQFFSEEFGVAIDRLFVYYLHANEAIYHPMDVAKQEGQTDSRKKVLYFGSILNLQGVDVILDALKEFADDDRINFEIIGPISDKMHKPLQPNVTYIDWLTQEDLAKHIASADLCLAGHFSGDIMKAKRTIPGKAYIYEAMSKPMILGDGMANHELFEKDDKHIFVEMGNPKALAAAIKDYFDYE